MGSSEKRTKILVSLWVAPLLVTILGGLAIWILPDDGKSVVWNFLGSAVKTVWSALSAAAASVFWFVNLPIPIWGVALGLVALFFLLVGIDRWQTHLQSAGAPSGQKEYVEDSYKSWKFKWEIGHHQFYNLRPVCNKCDCEVLHTSEYYPSHGYTRVIRCPNCEAVSPEPSQQDMEAAEKVFVHRYNTGEWKTRQVASG